MRKRLLTIVAGDRAHLKDTYERLANRVTKSILDTLIWVIPQSEINTECESLIDEVDYLYLNHRIFVVSDDIKDIEKHFSLLDMILGSILIRKDVESTSIEVFFNEDDVKYYNESLKKDVIVLDNMITFIMKIIGAAIGRLSMNIDNEAIISKKFTFPRNGIHVTGRTENIKFWAWRNKVYDSYIRPLFEIHGIIYNTAMNSEKSIIITNDIGVRYIDDVLCSSSRLSSTHQIKRYVLHDPAIEYSGEFLQKIICACDLVTYYDTHNNTTLLYSPLEEISPIINSIVSMYGKGELDCVILINGNDPDIVDQRCMSNMLYYLYDEIKASIDSDDKDSIQLFVNDKRYK